MYYIVYEIIFHFFNYSDNPTPLGFLIFNFKNTSKDRLDLLFITISFIINISLSLFFWRYIYKWYGKIASTTLTFKLLLVFLIISLLLLILFLLLMYFTKGLIFIILYTLYLPMGIMIMLMVPLFKFNKMILGDKN
ncbi:hypothetical protein BBI01_09400 [Chryseobacterium artocarpi]|uniref:Uncharacterized protein n=1 Tax=Chryseobacterium artocarpi TaxID=1414727 RepID=A0A1B8ZL65_9FLAO|nr:hypothetical protein BBI01_09400 [Chryseobacterium artocarpi]